jgi:thiol-disulfide isomerase/thioredoxin
MKRLFLILALLSSQLCASAQQIPAWSADELIRQTSSKDTLYIINFWATWCAPCVAELPQFNALHERYANTAVKIVMVSLDFKEDYPYKLGRFLERKQLSPRVVWLTDTNPNVFIPKIDNSWEGSIPATIIVHPGKGLRKFIEGPVTDQQVSRIVNKMLDQDQ